MSLPIFSYKPSFSTKATKTANLYEAKFGDGYSQRTPMGLNNVVQSWDVAFTNISTALATSIDTFLAGQGGSEPFYWTPPYQAQAKFICKAWRWEPSATDKNTVTATFDQVFDNQA